MAAPLGLMGRERSCLGATRIYVCAFKAGPDPLKVSHALEMRLVMFEHMGLVM